MLRSSAAPRETAVGCAVTLKWTTLRRSWSRMINLLPEDHLLELEQRDLLFLQHSHQIEEGPQEPGDHFLILLIQITLLDFVDQSLYFGRIDFGYLVARFSHSYHTSTLKGTTANRFFSMCGAELSRLILSSLVPEVTRNCRWNTVQDRCAAPPNGNERDFALVQF